MSFFGEKLFNVTVYGWVLTAFMALIVALVIAILL